MYKILFDFNGTLFFDTCFHQEAWSKVYKTYHGETADMPGSILFCGARNEDIIRAIAPGLSKEENERCSVYKESLYRGICRAHPEQLCLVKGAAELLQRLKDGEVPIALASASIKDNIDFYFETFHLGRWFDRETCVYDDGSYADKGEMHVEAAKRLGASIADCIVIEDSTSAISYAKQNGAGKIIAIGGDPVWPGLLGAGADCCIRDFTEFDCKWLEKD